jgi:hypothetical protein
MQKKKPELLLRSPYFNDSKVNPLLGHAIGIVWNSTNNVFLAKRVAIDTGSLGRG